VCDLAQDAAADDDPEHACRGCAAANAIASRSAAAGRDSTVGRDSGAACRRDAGGGNAAERGVARCP
jgi:hypothetical protein